MTILVINAGSSSLKFGLFDAEGFGELSSGIVDWRADARKAELTVVTGGSRESFIVEVPGYGSAFGHVQRILGENGFVAEDIRAVGHRVVHGGVEFRSSVIIDDRVIESIRQLSDLAPLHNPPALMAMEAARKELPGVPHVSVFDTAFFRDLPLKDIVYPLPYEWFEKWGIRRFGFHGISHEYCALRAAELLLADVSGLSAITLHLGNGCSATAVLGGRPVATTMGFTPLEGMMMGTRPGSVDPGILLYVMKERGLSVEGLHEALNHGSGLLGVSGVSSDFRKVEEAAARGEARARLALDIYADRIRSAVGSLAAVMGGVDALVFTAGVGENSASLRAMVCDGLSFMGLELDNTLNEKSRPDAVVSKEKSPVKVLTIKTREALFIAQETARAISGHRELPGETF